MDELKPLEAHAAAKGTPEWVVAAMRAKHHLPDGRTIAEAKFDELVKDIEGMTIGGGMKGPKLGPPSDEAPEPK